MMRKAVIVALVAALTPLLAYADSFSQTFIESQYNRITPAICLVEYAAEITSPNGETAKRDIAAMGVLVSADGLVMTHGHMVMDNSAPTNIRVVVGQGEAEHEYKATLLRKPEDINLVFLRIDAEKGTTFPYLKFSGDYPLQLGQELVVFGVMTEPFDYARIFNVRRVGSILTKPRLTYVLDMPVGFGFMVAPTVDAEGRLVGVVGFDLSPEEGGELYTRHGHPLIYQNSLFMKYIQHPPGEGGAHAEEQEAWLGILTQPLTDDLAEYWHLPQEGGVVVSTVVPGSPAASSGLLTGDVIVAVDGVSVRPKTDREVISFTKLIRELGPGHETTLRLYRSGEPTTLNVKLDSRPTSARDAGEYEDPVLGLTVRELTTDVRLMLNLEDDVKGVIVRRVTSGSAADAANVRPGVIVLRLADYPVTGIDDYKAAMEELAKTEPKEIPVFARYRTVTGYFRLEPRWSKHE